MRILVIEDDPDIRESLHICLEAESFVVDIAKDGESGFSHAKINDYDLILLDLNLPNKDGASICKELRILGCNTPILLLSVTTDPQQKVKLLDCGADDYLTKPFSFRELVARIRALLRRPHIVQPNILSIDDLTIDIPKQKVIRGDQNIYLTRKEFSLLEYLLRHRGCVVSRGMIMDHVWSADSDPFSNTIEAHILNLRKKIDNSSKQKIIQTVPGRGYKIDYEF